MINNSNIKRLSKKEIFSLAKFVVTENFNHHSEGNLPSNYLADVFSVVKEENSFFKNSQIFASKTNLGKIEGTIRVLNWNYKDELPLQKIFGINPLNIIRASSIGPIWHIGRFAIKKGNKSLTLLKKLMICAITPICENQDSIAFAECDSKLLKILNAFGIETIRIGSSMNYLGSETVPVRMNYNGLIKFYNRNRHLVSCGIFNQNKGINESTHSVMFNKHKTEQNYSLI